MNGNILIKPSVQQKFDHVMQSGRIPFFSAPCGFGKTVVANALLRKWRTLCLRAGGANLKDSWADIDDGELIVKGMHISPYDHGNIFNKDPRRPRRLLAHKSEIRRLGQQIKLQGYTLVPLSLYFKKGRVKLELGLCKGKKLYDKRATAAARDAKRDIERALKSR